MRLPDWQERLTGYLCRCARTPYQIGDHDCALFAAGAVEAVTGIDPAADWRGQYATKTCGLRMLRLAGHADHIAATAAVLPEIDPVFAAAGDIACVAEDATGSLALTVSAQTVNFSALNPVQPAVVSANIDSGALAVTEFPGSIPANHVVLGSISRTLGQVNGFVCETAGVSVAAKPAALHTGAVGAINFDLANDQIVVGSGATVVVGSVRYTLAAQTVNYSAIPRNNQALLFMNATTGVVTVVRQGEPQHSQLSTRDFARNRFTGFRFCNTIFSMGLSGNRRALPDTQHFVGKSPREAS